MNTIHIANWQKLDVISLIALTYPHLSAIILNCNLDKNVAIMLHHKSVETLIVLTLALIVLKLMAHVILMG